LLFWIELPDEDVGVKNDVFGAHPDQCLPALGRLIAGFIDSLPIEAVAQRIAWDFKMVSARREHPCSLPVVSMSSALASKPRTRTGPAWPTPGLSSTRTPSGFLAQSGTSTRANREAL